MVKKGEDMYSNNDFRYYKGGSYLAHYGKKGMKWRKHLKASTQYWIDNNITGNTARRQMDSAYQGYRQSIERNSQAGQQSNVNAYAQAKNKYHRSLVGKVDRATAPVRGRATILKNRFKDSVKIYKKTGRNSLTDSQARNRSNEIRKNPNRTTLSDTQAKYNPTKKRKATLRVGGRTVTGKDIVNRLFKRG